MIQFSNCKINLGLHITHERSDGYHNIQTIFYPIPFYDVLEVITSTQFLFTSTGLIINSDANNNLCVKAYNLLKNDYPNLPPLHLHLHKNIPMGAGIGGGSANATNTLQLLNATYNLQIEQVQLLVYTAVLGSDCPFFVLNTPCFAQGRGEILTPLQIDLSSYVIVLIFSNIGVSTAKAFAHIIPSEPTNNLQQTILQPITTWKHSLTNDFEKSIFPQHPELETTKNKLYQLGAVYASMSGSGSTVYGLFYKTNFLNNIISENFAHYKILNSKA